METTRTGSGRAEWLGRSRGRSVVAGPTLRRTWRWLPHVLVGLLALPFILHQNAWDEWSNALWLLELQTAHVRAFGSPTYFIDFPGSLFYPQQIFYAGPLFAVLAYPAVAVGAWPVLAALAAAAFCAMSAGVSWTARNLGVSGALAVLPGLMFAATPYIISDLYGRGDWAELVAIGGLSVAIGAGTSLVLGRGRNAPAAMTALAVAVAVVAGTHNITLLYGGLFALVLMVIVVPTAEGSSWRPLALVALSVAAGVALCGWFLLPDVWLSGKTYIASVSHLLIGQLRGFDHLRAIFDPLAGQPRGAVGTFDHEQTLVAGSAWCAIALAAALWRHCLDRRTAIMAIALAVTAAVIVVLIVNPGWWEHFPSQIQAIQFPFRLLTYLALATVLLVAVLLRRPGVARSRSLISLLAIAVALQLALGAYLAVSSEARPLGAAPPLTASTVTAERVPTAYAPLQKASYRITSGAIVSPPALIGAYVGRIGDDTPPEVRLYGTQPAGTLITTDVIGSPLIRVTGGARLVGTSPAGTAVLRILHSPWQATVSSRCSACLVPGGGVPGVLVLGHWATIAGTVALLTLAGMTARPAVRRRHRGGRGLPA